MGASYSQTLASSGGTTPKTWSITSGALPAGLSLNSSTGAITGTPGASGTANFTAQVACCGGATGSRALGITVNVAPSISTTSLPGGNVGSGYSQTLAATGGTGSYTWSVSAGALPAGLSLNPSTGAITGTPSAGGTANFTAQATDSVGVSDTQALSILVQDGPAITTSSLAAVTVGQAVSTSLASSGGVNPYTWSIASGALPAGITLDPSTGALTGTPTTAGTATFTAQVSDSNGRDDTQALTWTVNAAPSITTTSLAETTIGTAYSQNVSVTGGTGSLTWSIASGALPAGLSLNPSTGAITGTSTATGTANFTMRATDSNSVAADQALSIIVNPAPSVTTASLAEGAITIAYSQTLASTGGTGAHTWSITSGALPAGLSLGPVDRRDQRHAHDGPDRELHRAGVRLARRSPGARRCRSRWSAARV